MYFWYYLQFLIFTIKMFMQKLGEGAEIYQKFVHFGESTFLRCSPTTVVHVHVDANSLKNTQRATVLQTESQQEVK